jgi:hypothetical protein
VVGVEGRTTCDRAPVVARRVVQGAAGAAVPEGLSQWPTRIRQRLGVGWEARVLM